MNQVLVIAIVFITAYGFYRFYKWNTRPVEWSSAEVSALLQSWIDGRIDEERWEYFEACEISNSQLEEIRKEALTATLFESPLVAAEGNSLRLNEEGLKKFNELISRCNELTIRTAQT